MVTSWQKDDLFIRIRRSCVLNSCYCSPYIPPSIPTPLPSLKFVKCKCFRKDDPLQYFNHKTQQREPGSSFDVSPLFPPLIVIAIQRESRNFHLLKNIIHSFSTTQVGSRGGMRRGEMSIFPFPPAKLSSLYTCSIQLLWAESRVLLVVCTYSPPREGHVLRRKIAHQT